MRVLAAAAWLGVAAAVAAAGLLWWAGRTERDLYADRLLS